MILDYPSLSPSFDHSPLIVVYYNSILAYKPIIYTECHYNFITNCNAFISRFIYAPWSTVKIAFYRKLLTRHYTCNNEV